MRDSQSDPNRAAEVAKELIVDDEVDLMLDGRDAGDRQPGLHAMRDRGDALRLHQLPVAAVFIGRQADPAGGPPAWKPFNYTFHYFWGLEDIIAVFTSMWNQLDTNKKIGGLFPNDADGNAWGDPVNGVPPAFTQAGYKLTDPGRYQNLTDDFSAQITAFKKASAEIVTGVVLPPDFTTFRNQANQQGFKPKAITRRQGHPLPASRSRGSAPLGHNLSSEVWWSPNHPFKSSLTGQSAAELAKAFEDDAKRPVDPADRLRPLALRGRGRHDQARQRRKGSECAARRHRRDQPRHHRRPGQVGRRQPPALRSQERLPRPRWSAASGGGRTTASSIWSSSTTRTRRKSRRAADARRSHTETPRRLAIIAADTVRGCRHAGLDPGIYSVTVAQAGAERNGCHGQPMA